MTSLLLRLQASKAMELTGASPGHSYTVKSPPTSSSSDVISGSCAFCSGLWLQREQRRDDVTGKERGDEKGQEEEKNLLPH